MCTTTSAPSVPEVATPADGGGYHVYVSLPQCTDGGDVEGGHCRPVVHQVKCRGGDDDGGGGGRGGGVVMPAAGETVREAAALCRLACPIALTALMLYSRSALSMLFLGSLGDLPLAAGSLAVAFANITGYSVLSGLSLGMDPLCSQAFGARQPRLLGLTLYRSVLFLLCCSLPLSALWLNMAKILLFLGQDRDITAMAQDYLLFSLPDLFSFSLIHPLRVYLRSQGITQPLAVAAAAAVVFHVPANYVLVGRLRLGAPGVAAAASASNFVLLAVLLAYVARRDEALREAGGPTAEWLAGWGPLARLAAPSCVSVCLEWWWYEVMILLCGLLPEPRPAVASMGVLMQTTALVYVFPSSLGFGVSTRVGNELGANRPGRARAAPHMATVGCGVLRGTARPARAAHVNLGAFYLVGMPVAVVLAFGLGVGFVGLWVGLLAAQVCCAGLMLCVVGSTDWEAQARRAQALTSSAAVSGKADAAEGGGRWPEKGEHQEGEKRRHVALISSEEADPETAEVL
uniref:Protein DETOXIFICATION n=1 Tax=Oryza glumipatula TaxID=40148 RepID=A0A0E0AAW5_9ORYZ